MLGKLILINISIIILIGCSWLANLYKLTHCDFEAPYKAEIIHGIGVFPPAALVTCWFSFDEEGK